MLWRRASAGLLISVLAVVPSAATVCAMSCVDGPEAATPTLVEAASQHQHSAAAPQTSTDVAVRAVPHDCTDHAGGAELTATVRSTVAGAAADSPAAVLAPEAFRHAVGPAEARREPVHGPPGYTLSFAPPVLRI